ncbi:hypothetical protein FOQG_19226 [Fusarium oxysporum f. sp. raphani 54005]|uniref:Uncharacterized protein n=1 Tax=Fusarium oxysporum f. sp. raphani 54005 TaxID=1089458 RepID=X0B2M9_FUSOX|nr:hypothetical protein FOQG_19226 [Fusarium oxysporum f. sp. raphani 54005]
MDLNTSVSQVSTWLDSLPFDQPAPSSPPSPSATRRALKRQRSLHLNESRKRPYPASPPESHSHSQTSCKARIRSMPATPAKRTRPDLDNDQTPRAQVTVANPLTNPPSLSSRSESSLASQSDASMSRDSKRSKRSQSPAKLFPMYGSSRQGTKAQRLCFVALSLETRVLLSVCFRLWLV